MAIDFPVTIDILGYKILIHPILEWIGIFVGMRLYSYLKKHNETSFSKIQRLSIILGALLGALIGSKLIGTLEDPFAFINSDIPLLYFWTSNTIVGGLAFGLIGVEISKKVVGHKESTGDLMIYPLIVAMLIGRIGCFLTGIAENTYGIPTDSIFGMYLGDEYLRHPVALYEIVFLIGLGIFIALVKKNIIYQSGFLFQLFMLSYFTFRFFLDYIKPKVDLFYSLSTIQLTCLCVIIYYIFKLINSKRIKSC